MEFKNALDVVSPSLKNLKTAHAANAEIMRNTHI